MRSPPRTGGDDPPQERTRHGDDPGQGKGGAEAGTLLDAAVSACRSPLDLLLWIVEIGVLVLDLHPPVKADAAAEPTTPVLPDF